MNQVEIEAAKDAGLLGGMSPFWLCEGLTAAANYLTALETRTSRWRFALKLGLKGAIKALEALKARKCGNYPS